MRFRRGFDPIVNDNLVCFHEGATAGTSIYASQDVKNILKKWYRELAEDAKNFETQANKVYTWDQQLKENQRALESVVDRMHGILVAQDDLQSMCDEIETYQDKIESEIKDLERSANNEIAALSEEKPSKDDEEREENFKLAENLEAAVGQMEATLQKLSANLSGKTADGETLDPVMKVSDFQGRY